MAEHAALGVTRRATGVDEAAALAGLLGGHLGLDHVVLYGGAHLHEVFPENEAWASDSLG